MSPKIDLPAFLVIVVLSLTLLSCGSGSGGDGGVSKRSFYMGTTPFSATPTSFPEWRFANLDDKDLLSIHADDFYGVPWVEFRDNLILPAAWVSKWAALASAAQATGKPLYLAVSPLGNRRTLAPRVDAAGNPVANWAPVDANGCYPFATDGGANGWQTAYIRYVTYLINLMQPAYVSPAAEMNIPFVPCSADKAAWVSWYGGAHNAIKTAFPNLPVFATFQAEHMYGVSDAQAACAAPTTVEQCFDQRLAEALAIPGDRIAFSTYPLAWKYRSEYGFSFPTDTYQRVRNATSRRIWISETGWAAVKVLSSYPHGGSGSCGAELVPPAFANDIEQSGYMSWLLAEANNRQLETVVWWLNWDYLDGAVAATCPCGPATSDTCVLADNFHTAAGDTGESLLRIFGNMALRTYDGTARPAHATWSKYLARPRRPIP